MWPRTCLTKAVYIVPPAQNLTCCMIEAFSDYAGAASRLLALPYDEREQATVVTLVRSTYLRNGKPVVPEESRERFAVVWRATAEELAARKIPLRFFAIEHPFTREDSIAAGADTWGQLGDGRAAGVGTIDGDRPAFIEVVDAGEWCTDRHQAVRH